METKRRTFIAALAALFTGSVHGQNRGGNQRVFYITGLVHGEQNDCTVPPLKVVATDRADALRQILAHATVWTEEEFPHDDFYASKDCAAIRSKTRPSRP